MSYFLSTEALTVGYPHKIIIKNINLTVKAGEALCILGRNGEGKSTLIKTLLGLLPPLGGHIYLDGKSLKTIPVDERARFISYVPQSTFSGFGFTVLDNVIMGRATHLSLFAQPSTEDHEMALAALARLGIAQLAETPFPLVSGGERQLVLIARALVQNAQLIILDEPTSSLDFYNQDHILQILMQLKKDGRSIIFSTHHPDQAFRIADTIVMLKKNDVLASGEVNATLTEKNLSTLYETPISVTEIEGRKVTFIK